MRQRLGYSLADMLVVIAIMGVLTAMAAPKMKNVRSQAELGSAKARVASYLATARAAAIQRGSSVNFNITAGSDDLTVTDASTGSTIGSRVNIDPSLVQISASRSSVSFDSRGFATSLTNAGATFVLVAGSRRDSVCVNRMGMINQGRC